MSLPLFLQPRLISSALFSSVQDLIFPFFEVIFRLPQRLRQRLRFWLLLKRHLEIPWTDRARRRLLRLPPARYWKPLPSECVRVARRRFRRFHLQLWRRSAGVLGSAFPVIDLCSRVADRVRKRGGRFGLSCERHLYGQGRSPPTSLPPSSFARRLLYQASQPRETLFSLNRVDFKTCRSKRRRSRQPVVTSSGPRSGAAPRPRDVRRSVPCWNFCTPATFSFKGQRVRVRWSQWPRRGALPAARFRARASQLRQHRASVVRSDAYRCHALVPNRSRSRPIPVPHTRGRDHSSQKQTLRGLSVTPRLPSATKRCRRTIGSTSIATRDRAKRAL
jgi:hypothetical protein